MKRLITIALVLSLTSCAGFQSGELEEVSSLPEVDRSKEVYISMDFTRQLNGNESYMMNEWKKSSYLGYAEDVFADQKNVTVVDEASEADVHLHVDFTENERGSLGMAVLTGLTFWLIPNEISFRYTANVSVLKPRGTAFQISDHTTTYHQIFLLPVMPVKLPAIERAHAVEKIFRHTFQRLHQQNVVHQEVHTNRGSEEQIGDRESSTAL